MANLAEYVLKHTQRGECNCGRCIDRGNRPDPEGHTADLFFFKVAARNEPSADEFSRLTKEHGGEFCECDPLDGNEHSYMELGGWIGDQGLAMQYMGLGTVLGIFNLLTPNMLPGLPPDLASQMAGSGMVTVQRKREATPCP